MISEKDVEQLKELIKREYLKPLLDEAINQGFNQALKQLEPQLEIAMETLAELASDGNTKALDALNKILKLNPNVPPLLRCCI